MTVDELICDTEARYPYVGADEVRDLLEALREVIQNREALHRAIKPIVTWAKATLQSKSDNQDGFMPSSAIVCGVDHINLTVKDLRVLIAAAEGCGDDNR